MEATTEIVRTKIGIASLCKFQNKKNDSNVVRELSCVKFHFTVIEIDY